MTGIRLWIGAIAGSPDAKDYGHHSVDLRSHSGLDSEYEMPGWVYGLSCRSVARLHPTGAETPKPFCRFRLARMAAQFNRLRFPEGSALYPYSIIGVAEYPDALGKNNAAVIAVKNRPLTSEQVKGLIGPDDARDYADRDFLAELVAKSSAV
jgi:hypothetical protein